MSLIKLTVEARSTKEFDTPYEILVDTTDICRPIIPEGSGSIVYIDESIFTSKREKSVNPVKFVVSEAPAAIAALSDDLFLVNLTSMDGRTILAGKEGQCFPIHRVVGPITALGEGCEFLCYEGRSPVLVNYKVAEDIATIQSTL